MCAYMRVYVDEHRRKLCLLGYVSCNVLNIQLLILALFIIHIVQSQNIIAYLVPQQPALCHGVVPRVLSEPLFLLDHLLEVVTSITGCGVVLLLC